MSDKARPERPKPQAAKEDTKIEAAPAKRQLQAKVKEESPRAHLAKNKAEIGGKFHPFALRNQLLIRCRKAARNQYGAATQELIQKAEEIAPLTKHERWQIDRRFLKDPHSPRGIARAAAKEAAK